MNSNLQQKVNRILKEMKSVYKNDKRPWVIGYSGGKDSTTVVQLTFMMLQKLSPEERTKDIYIVSSNTLIENPIVLGYLNSNSELINDSAREQNLPIYTHVVHPDYSNTYWTNIIGKGLPTPTSIRFRWCTERLKINPSNTFIENKVRENGEVIVLLGVRKSESIARAIRIRNREIDGYLLTPHNSLKNTYVYNPIVELSTDDVWNILLDNNGYSPWNTNNRDLFNLYKDSDSECPFTTTNDNDTPSCGKSRFGCWICTVVAKDKSLTGFIENGELWLQPLLDFREWILNIRNKHEYRTQYRRDGNHYYKKLYLNKLPLIDEYLLNEDYIFSDSNGDYYLDLKVSKRLLKNKKPIQSTDKEKIYLELLPLKDNNLLDKSKIKIDDNGEYINILGYGPFNFKARQLILKKLLETQNIINQEYEIELITKQELEAIDRIWDDEIDISHRTLVDLYYNTMNEKLPWDYLKKPIFDEDTINMISTLGNKYNIDQELINKLLITTNDLKYYTNKTVINKSIAKILNQKYLHKNIIEEISNDNK